jgi:hypothetical protein
MHDDEENVGIVGELPVQDADEIEGGGAVVQGEGAAHASYARLLSRWRGRLAGNRVLEGRKTFAAVALLRQLDGLLQIHLSRSGSFFLLR